MPGTCRAGGERQDKRITQKKKDAEMLVPETETHPGGSPSWHLGVSNIRKETNVLFRLPPIRPFDVSMGGLPVSCVDSTCCLHPCDVCVTSLVVGRLTYGQTKRIHVAGRGSDAGHLQRPRQKTDYSGTEAELNVHSGIDGVQVRRGGYRRNPPQAIGRVVLIGRAGVVWPAFLHKWPATGQSAMCGLQERKNWRIWTPNIMRRFAQYSSERGVSNRLSGRDRLSSWEIRRLILRWDQSLEVYEAGFGAGRGWSCAGSAAGRGGRKKPQGTENFLSPPIGKGPRGRAGRK